MKILRFAFLAGILSAVLLVAPSIHDIAFGQFPTTASTAPAAPAGGPVAIGGPMLQSDGKNVSLVGGAVIDPNPPRGGLIQLSAFGWLEPYVDTVLQALIAAGFAWIGKSKYSQWLDQSARDALQTFVKNRASSLLADGAVRMQDKAVHVDSPLLYKAASEASTAIPDALKRFGLTPDVVAQKIVDAIPQTEAGAAIIATAHAANSADPVPVTDRPSSAPQAATPNQPPVTA